MFPIELRNYGDNYVCPGQDDHDMLQLQKSYIRGSLSLCTVHPGVITRAVYRSVLANNLNSDIM